MKIRRLLSRAGFDHLAKDYLDRTAVLTIQVLAAL
jgi:hypothetical protein